MSIKTINYGEIHESDHVSIDVYSDIGGREEQQDCAYVSCSDEGKFFAAVCDGMGGMSSGRAASRAAIQLISQGYEKRQIDIISFYQQMIEKLDAEVYFMKDQYKRRLKAGTTIVSACLEDEKLYWLSIGDSRLYLKRNEQLIQITKDNNYYQILNGWYLSGRISSNQVIEESYKGEALTSYLGKGGISEYNLSTEPLRLVSGDLILLATDGLWRSFNGDELYETLAYFDDLSLIKEALIRKVNTVPILDRDNCTFILIRFNG